MTYKDLFNRAFAHEADPNFAPFDYQRRLAEEGWPACLDVPTGMGKTAAVTLAWLWKRGWRLGRREVTADPDTPRRLVYCLPMRVLVEQTYQAISEWVDRLDLAGNPGHGKVSIHVLMGGADDTDTWAEYPEEDMILIGTQDMLLSRALMRGYGMSRYVWPVHFALLHNDALWVFDEVQLMGSGLATSAQLDAFRRSYPLAKPSRSLWLSATLKPEWLLTVDMKPHAASLRRQTISDGDRAQASMRLNAIKSVKQARVELEGGSLSKKGMSDYLEVLCDLVLSEHDASAQTLVIVNRVDRAQGLYRLLLNRRRAGTGDLLIHARFRAQERAEQARRLRSETAVDRIVIATQAIEAGVDITSKVLITELAPWSSLVQRFGRCNRYGEQNSVGGAHIFWINVTDDSGAVLPYSSVELESARKKIILLNDASPLSLPPTDENRSLTPVLRRKDLLDLFNTDPDISGFDVDVSDYIRDSDVPGLQVFWREFTDDPNLPSPQSGPERAELCPISMAQAEGIEKRDKWLWDSLDAKWRRFDEKPRPGMIVLLRAADGGYGTHVGFDASHKQSVHVVPERAEFVDQQTFDEDPLSNQPTAVLLNDHLKHAAEHARKLCASVGEEAYAAPVIRAARWHDVGKAHEVFQRTLHSCDRSPPGLLAKSPCHGRHERRFFRHEVASMLAWLHQNERELHADLIAYLVVAHHGKVRMAVRAMPSEPVPPSRCRHARGIWEGDPLPELAFDGEQSVPVALSLAIMELGIGEQGCSWTERATNLLAQLGPFHLAWLEALVRHADWRASAAEQEKPSRGSPSDA